MKILDLETWDRKNHFNYYKGLDYPHFNICGNIDITEFYKFVKENESSFFIAFLYVAVKTANNIKEFRYRIRGNDVVEHKAVSPSFTVMTSKDVFTFCTAKFVDNYSAFVLNTASEIEKSKKLVNIEDEPGRDDLLYITSIPWIAFTSITHPIHMSPADSIPRISWGKFFEENGRIKIPLSVQAHHALMDGVHVGQYFNSMEEILRHPKKYLL